jgi:hypothetical protein
LRVITKQAMSSVYEAIDLEFYKDTRDEVRCAFALDCRMLMGMAKEMIYYNHWSNSVMFEYLRSNDDISLVIEKVDVPTLEEYFNTGKLF